MRGRCALTLLCLCACPTGLATAHEPRAPGQKETRLSTAALVLLQNEYVQTEIGLTAEQKTVMGNALKRAKAPAASGTPAPASAYQPRELIAGLTLTNTSARSTVANALSDVQRLRLRQIELQRLEAFSPSEAMLNAHVAGELKLAAEQLARLREIDLTTRAQRLSLGRTLNPNRGGAVAAAGADTRSRSRQIREAQRAEVMAALTDQQRAKWTELLGEPFAFRRPSVAAGLRVAPETTDKTDGNRQ